MGGTVTVEELEIKSGETGTGGRFEMHIAPTAVLDRGVSNSRRRVVFKILRMGSTPLRVGVCHSSLVPGSNWSRWVVSEISSLGFGIEFRVLGSRARV
jgi:hypothetical protein